MRYSFRPHIAGAWNLMQGEVGERKPNAKPSPASNYPLPKVGDTFAGHKVLKVEKVQPEETTRTETPDGLPAPRTDVRLQHKYTKAIPLESGKVAYQTVQQWVFHPEGDKDGSLICVEDGNHCIGLLKLKEQLGRPANDPLGIR